MGARQELDLPDPSVLAERASSRDDAATSPAAKRFGLPDARIAARARRRRGARFARARGLPGRLAVDSCAAEFEAQTPYYYLSYEQSDERGRRRRAAPSSCSAAARTGSGRGSSSTTAASHAAQAFRRLGYEAVLVNSNPETVSTDYDTSDRLYLEPLTLERVLDVCELEQPLGVVVSLGGQTPLRLAPGLAEAGVPLLGDPLDAIDAAEDRGRFAALLAELGLAAPRVGRGRDAARRRCEVAERIGYPVLVRPHHVLGGRGMRVVRGPDELALDEPCLVDRFLEGAIELDVDALCDGEGAWVAAILEHVEPAGVHSGDSACVVPGAVGDAGARGGDPADRRRRSRRRSARAAC